MTPDAAIIADVAAQMANAYHDADYRGEILSHIYLLAATGTPLEEAARRAYAWADRERRVDRGRVSLDALQSEFGDALNYAALPCPSLSDFERWYDSNQASGKATPRVPEKGIAEQDEGLMYLVSVIRNLVERNVVNCDPVTCAIDVRSLEPVIRRAAEMLLQSATKAELKEAGVKPRHWREAAAELERYARFRADLI